MTRPVLGLFVGGAARRMGGVAKGLIRPDAASEGPAAHLLGLGRRLGLTSYLVGDARVYAQAFPGLGVVADAPGGLGPLGGLRGLCSLVHGPVIALACDMPYVSEALLARLVGYEGLAPVLAPRGTAGFWEPLCARYDAAAALPWIEAAVARGDGSLQRLLSAAGAEELALTHDERTQLRDWDTPADLPPGAIAPPRP